MDTKSPLVTRDIDILKNIQKHSPVIVKLTIITADDQLCKKIEQKVAISSQCFKALKELWIMGFIVDSYSCPFSRLLMIQKKI